MARVLGTAIATTGLAGALLALPAAADSTTRVVVDDDNAQCPNAEFETIQKAVDHAAKKNSDTNPQNNVDLISVCPGVYAEQVTVRTSVTIRGVPEAVSAIDCFATAVELDPTQHAILDGAGSSAQSLFTLEANSIQLQGFVIKDAWTPVPRPTNVRLWRHGIDASPDYSGYRVHDNLLLGNTTGILFRSDGVLPSSFHNNCLRDNAWGLANELLPLIDAQIHHNFTFRTGNFAYEQTIGVDRVTFDHNVSVNDNTAYGFGSSSSTTASENTITNARIGMRVFAANVGLQISNNSLEAQQVGLGIAPSGLNSGVLIWGNTITGAPGWTGIGISPGSLTKSSILDNAISGFQGGGGLCNGCGIAVSAGNTENVVHGNTVTNNARDGIQVAAGATNNSFQENTMLGNGNLGGVDARDLNTTLPLNEWVRNVCLTDFPAGTICPPAP